jgi:hypothetical protein
VFRRRSPNRSRVEAVLKKERAPLASAIRVGTGCTSLVDASFGDWRIECVDSAFVR